MRIGEKKETQNDATFVAFYDMHAVTFVVPDEMVDASIAGLQWCILIARLNHTGSHKPSDSHYKPFLHGKKKIYIYGTRITNLLLRIMRKVVVRLSFYSPPTICHRDKVVHI